MKSIKAILGQRAIVTIDVASSVADAARVMTEHQVGALPVVDDGRLAGIFSERDVLTRVVAANRDPRTTQVREVMSSDLLVAHPEESYCDGLKRMQQAHIRHLIVLDGDEALVGIVSLRDLMAADLDEKQEELTMLNAYVHYIPVDLHAKQQA
jgi:CBS domain-containing protein